MDLYPHEMLPDVDHDGKALQDFVTSFRAHLASKVRPGTRAVYEKRVKPGFEQKFNREPADKTEVGKEMTQDPYYQFCSARVRR